MRNKIKALTAAIALMTATTVVNAETVTKTTVQKQEVMNNSVSFEIDSFDINKDGRYAKSEIGEKLFYIYDTDGNEIIDSNEFDAKRIITVVPVQEETYTYVDTDNDGLVEESTYTFTRMMKDTGLAIYDSEKDGLSAKEFIGTFYRDVDKNDDKTVDLEEWKSTYLSSVKGITESEKYN